MGTTYQSGDSLMGFPVAILASLPSIIQGVTALVEQVEKLVRRKGAGAEKKEMVLDAVEAQLIEDAEKGTDDGVYGEMLFLDGKYDWGCLITKIPTLRPQIGNLVDAVVAIKNTLKECDE
jgi:hypothetical protein